MYNFFLFIILFFLSNNIYAEVLNEVEIAGNKRTSKEAIIKHGRIKMGEELGPKELQTIIENLGRIGQIHITHVVFNTGILKIQMEDKWTLFPIPIINQSGNYSNRGFIFYEDNFLGSLGTFAPGISWSNSILNYLLYYQDESLFDAHHGIKFLFLRKSEFVEFTRTNTSINSYESRYNSYLIAPNFLFKDQVFKAGPIYIDKTIYKSNSSIIRDISKGLFFRHHWNAYTNLDIMYEGFFTTYDFYALQQKNKKIAILNEANVNWSIPSNKSFYNFGIHGFYTTEKSYLYAKNLGGEDGFRGYDKSSLPIKQNFGFFIQYQQHLFKSFFLAPFFEYNNSLLVNSIQKNKQINENAIGAGLRYYFKKISIPAVMFDFARNIDDKSNHFLFNIGISI